MKNCLPQEPVERFESNTRHLCVSILQLRQTHGEEVGPVVEEELFVTDTEQTSHKRKQSLETTSHDNRD